MTFWAALKALLSWHLSRPCLGALCSRRQESREEETRHRVASTEEQLAGARREIQGMQKDRERNEAHFKRAISDAKVLPTPNVSTPHIEGAPVFPYGRCPAAPL